MAQILHRFSDYTPTITVFSMLSVQVNALHIKKILIISITVIEKRLDTSWTNGGEYNQATSQTQNLIPKLLWKLHHLTYFVQIEQQRWEGLLLKFKEAKDSSDVQCIEHVIWYRITLAVWCYSQLRNVWKFITINSLTRWAPYVQTRVRVNHLLLTLS